jgi:hypothetical protein
LTGTPPKSSKEALDSLAVITPGGIIPDFDDPDLMFLDWEDRVLAYKVPNFFRVFGDRTLKIAPESWTIPDIFPNSTVISKEDALWEQRP